MAETKTDTQARHESGRSIARREREPRGLRRWDEFGVNPFEFMGRMSDEMDRWFDRIAQDFGFPRRSWMTRSAFASPVSRGAWVPRIEAFQKGDKFIVRADLPGLKKDEVDLELTDDALTIRGERHEEHEEEREGAYQSEREYGQFYRTIPLPEGVISEKARATFRNGVLEITMPAAPAEANRGRKLEIHEQPPEGK